MEPIVFTETSTGPNGTIQQWTVPEDGNYRITTVGAHGGGGYLGGRGAKMSGVFQLAEGETLKILVGQEGEEGHYTSGGRTYSFYGGGGGTFVVKSDNTPLIISGGGGGGSYNVTYRDNYADATTTETFASNMSGGSGGSGTTSGGGGGGFSGDGSGYGGKSFLNGGAGYDSAASGGFGGGGGARRFTDSGYHNFGSGGGGGYSGGSGSYKRTTTNTTVATAYGGGSYNAGIDQINEKGVEEKASVRIEILEPAGTILEETVCSVVSNANSHATYSKARDVSISSHTEQVASMSTLSFSQDSELLSQVFPIESEVQLASVIAARHTETRAGPIKSHVITSKKIATIAVTSSVEGVETHAERQVQRDSAVNSSMKSITSHNIRLLGHRLGSLRLGTVIKDPNTNYNDASIEWIVVAQNHPGAPANSTMLLAKHVLSFKPFSSATDGNKDTGSQYGPDRRGYGDWERSDIRKWLNGTEILTWVTEQAVSNNPYDGELGFLRNIGSSFMNNLLATQVVTNIPGTDESYTTEDKFFFLSQTEVGLLNDLGEGTPLSADMQELIRFAKPTQEAIDHDTRDIEIYPQDPTGWYLRTPDYYLDSYFGERIRIRYYAANADMHGKWYVPIDPVWGGVGVRPAANVNSDVYVAEFPEADGIYTMVYDAIEPEVLNETVSVASQVEAIKSDSVLVRENEYQISSYSDCILTHSEAVFERVDERIITSNVNEVSVEVTASNRVTATVKSNMTTMNAFIVARKQNFSEAVSHAGEFVSSAYADGKIGNHETVIVTTSVSSMDSTVEVEEKKLSESVSHTEAFNSYVKTETFAANRQTFTVETVIKPVESSNKRYVRANATVTTESQSFIAGPVREAERVVTSETHAIPIESSSAIDAGREVVVHSHVEAFETYAVTRENDGKSIRAVISSVQNFYSSVSATHSREFPTVFVSEHEIIPKLGLEEARIVLRRE